MLMDNAALIFKRNRCKHCVLLCGYTHTSLHFDILADSVDTEKHINTTKHLDVIHVPASLVIISDTFKDRQHRPGEVR